jgi:polar amino acid transport system substrate-binding protein
MQAVAKCVGFTSEYQKLDFNGLVPALQAKRIDLITSGMYANADRAKVVNFVTYMKAAEAAVVRKGNPKNVKSLDTLCGTTVAQVVGTVEVELAEKQSKACVAAGKPAIKFINFTQSTQLTQALAQGRADVFLTDSGVAARLAKDFAGAVETAFPIVSDFKFGVAVNKSDADLLKAINEAITALHAKGELTKIAKKWGFAEDQVVQPAVVTS